MQPRVDYKVVTEVGTGKEVATHMLLYLSGSVFSDGSDQTAQLVRDALDADVAMVLVQELDPGRGACAFRRYFELSPPDLVKKRRLFDTVAVPLYPGDAHRAVSILNIAQNMGAKPLPWWRRCLARGPSVIKFHRSRGAAPPTLSATKRGWSLQNLRQSLSASSFRESIDSMRGSVSHDKQPNQPEGLQAYLRVQRRLSKSTAGATRGRMGRLEVCFSSF